MTSIVIDEENCTEQLATANALSATDPAASLEIYNAISERFPAFKNEATWYAAVGTCQYKLGKNDEALSAFTKAGELDPKHVAACTNAGSLSKQSGKLDTAIHWFKKALETDPHNSTALMQLAESYLALPEPNYLQTISTLDIIIAASLTSNEPNFRAHELRAFSALKSDNSTAMLSDWERVKPFANNLSKNQKHIFAVNLSILSMLKMNNSEFEDALVMHKDVNSLQPSANNYFNHAVCLVKMNRAKEAIPIFRLSLKEDNHFIKSILGLSSILIMAKTDKQNNMKEARDLLIDVTSEGQDLATHVDALYYLSIAFLNLNQHEEANNTLLRVIEYSDGNHWRACSLVANYEINKQNWVKGIEFLEKARSSSNAAQADFSVHFNLGICHLHNNDPVNSLKYFEIATSIDPSNPKGLEAVSILRQEHTTNSNISGIKREDDKIDGDGSGDEISHENDTNTWEWYCLDDKTGDNNGPYTVNDLKLQFNDGFIGKNTQVWAEELNGGWSQLKNVPELYSVYGAATRPARRKKSGIPNLLNLDKAKSVLKVVRPNYMNKHKSMDNIEFGNTKNLMAKWSKK
jgi:tetratricopeptide (TPR) repeat protein